jgi:long-chain acyl-CoA synthetase
LIAHCRTGLAEFKVPARIEIRESLPKTAVGKILHRLLREEGQATDPAPEAK